MNVRRLGWIGWALLAVCAIVVVLAAGCAPERYLTLEQDAEIARRCAEGCKVVPLWRWQEIEEQLRQRGTSRI